jgi:hypothetical protein
MQIKSLQSPISPSVALRVNQLMMRSTLSSLQAVPVLLLQETTLMMLAITLLHQQQTLSPLPLAIGSIIGLITRIMVNAVISLVQERE